ncbi:MAG: hypothetical protein HYU28_05245 [Actinobacteria bacterium]|nr:hypothetical protein [Actinomycetota bacterium]
MAPRTKVRSNHHDEDVAPELEPLHLVDKPDGPGAAAMISAGIGIFVLGLFTVLSEASESIHVFLEDFQGPVGVGPLAGKTILGSLAFIVSGLGLGAVWWKRDIDLKKAFWVGLALGIAGALMLFPPFFQAFAAE